MRERSQLTRGPPRGQRCRDHAEHLLLLQLLKRRRITRMSCHCYEGQGAATTTSDDSGISEQKRQSVEASGHTTPVGVELRPETFKSSFGPMDHDESTEGQLPYPEFLPAPLKMLDLSQKSEGSADWELCRELHARDPTLAAIVSRLTAIEKMQVATIQKERNKAGRVRPSTATGTKRSAFRCRKTDAVGHQLECSTATADTESGGSCHTLAGFSELTLSQRPATCSPANPQQDKTASCSSASESAHLQLAKPNMTPVLQFKRSDTNSPHTKPKACCKAKKLQNTALRKPPGPTREAHIGPSQEA